MRSHVIKICISYVFYPTYYLLYLISSTSCLSSSISCFHLVSSIMSFISSIIICFSGSSVDVLSSIFYPHLRSSYIFLAWLFSISYPLSPHTFDIVSSILYGYPCMFFFYLLSSIFSVPIVSPIFYLLGSIFFLLFVVSCLSSSIFSRFSSSFCLLRHFTHLVCAYLIYYVFHLLSSTPTIHLLFYILYLLSFFGLLSSSLYLAASLSYFLSYILCLCMFSIFFFLSSAFYRLSADQPGPAQLSQSAHAIAHFLILLSSSKADVRRTILSTSPSSDKSDVQQTVYSASPASQPSPSSLDSQLTHSLLDVMVFREKM